MIKSNSHRPSRLHFINRKGQTLVEYAMIVAIISTVAIATMLGMGGQVRNIYTGTVAAQINTAQNGGQSAPSR